MIFHELKMDVTPGVVPTIVHVKQYQTDLHLQLELYSRYGDISFENTPTVTIRGTKPDGTGFTKTGYVYDTSDATVTVGFFVEEQMTVVAGRIPYEIILEGENEDETLKTISATFYLEVQRAAMDADTIVQDSEGREFEAVVQQMVDEYLDDHPEITTTVQDGSITEAKLASAVVSAYKNSNYTIPNGTITEAMLSTAVKNAYKNSNYTIADGSVAKAKLATDAVSYIESMKEYIDDKIYSISNRTVYAEKMKDGGFSYVDYARKTKSFFTNNSEVYVWLQSACYIDSIDKVILGFVKTDYSAGILVKYDFATDTVISRSSAVSFGHMNDMTYNPTTGKLYVATMDTGTYAYKIVVVNPSNLSFETSISINDNTSTNYSISQLSYDRRNDLYYAVVSGAILKILDTSFNVLQSVELQEPSEIGITGLTAQGSVCIAGDFWVMYQDVDNVYFFSYDLSSGNIYRYQKYPNVMYHEECEGATIAGNTMYSFGAYYDNVLIRAYDIGTASSTQPTLQNSGILLGASADLNEVKSPGKYFSPDATYTAGFSHTPSELGSGFSMYVLNQGQDWIVQILIENSVRGKIYLRARDAQATWGAWLLNHKEVVSSTAISENGTYQIPPEMMDYHHITVACNRNYYFGSVTIPVASIKQGDVANGTICMSDMTHYWTLKINSSGLITVTSLNNVTAPYIRLLAS